MTPDHGAEQEGVGFAALLRTRRKDAGLTQSELATRAGVGVRTVRDLERGRASRPQRTTVELLAHALGLSGPARFAFIAAARGQAPVTPRVPTVSTAQPATPAVAATQAAAERGRGLPPPAGELIGRDRDVAEVVATLSRSEALVSLVGLAGVGKTSLALTVIDQVRDSYPGGVAGIVVTEGSTESDVLTVAAAVLGVARADELASRLAGAPSLLLVDAVERSPGAVAEALHRLAEAAPSLRVLATGRHPVGLPGERVWPVAPLDVPPAEITPEAGLDAVSTYPAAALFLDRLGRVRRDQPEPGEVGALIRLVRRLGGLPLAIELAAARGRVLDLNEILDRYGDRLLDLAGPEAAPAISHQAVTGSLRDAVAASYRLLEPEEQLAVRRLSVFGNRWSVELGEAMLADTAAPGGALDGDPVPLLDRLISLGLLGTRGTGSLRFRLLDVVRDYAQERAAAEGELTAIRRRHAVVFAQLASRIAPQLAGANLAGAVSRLDEVTSDLWAALAHSAIDDPHTALLLAANLPRWWRFRGRDGAGRQWLRRLLDDPRTVDADPVVRAWAQLGVAQLAAEHGEGPTELPEAETALEVFRAQGDVTGEIAARNQLCALWMATGGYDEARRHGVAALALATRTGRIRDMAIAQNNLAWHEIRVGDLAAARRRMAAVDRLAAQCGEDRLRAVAMANVAEVTRLDGRYDDAVMLGRRAIAALERLGDPGHRARSLGTVGLSLALAERAAEAVEVLAQLRTADPAGALAGSVSGSGSGAGSVGSGSGAGGSGVPTDALGPSAMIEATLAMNRGDRDLAAEWYGVAVDAYANGRDLRDLAEALVGLVSVTEDATLRGAVVARLDDVCKEGGITLVPAERERVERATSP